MRTLFQIYADMTTLKSQIKALEPLWHVNDGILLLSNSVAYLDWLEAYLAESDIGEVKYLYALKSDFDALDNDTQRYLNMSSRRCQLLTDQQWVAISVSSLINTEIGTQVNDPNEASKIGFDRIVTLA